MAYYIGVDGGGTKTAFALFNEKKQCLDIRCGLGSNHENLQGGFEKASERIFQGICSLLAENQLSLDQVDRFCMGLAGIDHPWQHDQMVEKLEKLGISDPVIFNDGYLAVFAGTKDGVGIGYNAGTGNCCNAADSTGALRQLGGLGDYTGDLGSGPWIGQAVYRAIYEMLYLDAPDTSMKEAYDRIFGIRSKEEFLQSVSLFERPSRQGNLPAVVSLFFDALNQSDRVAEAIAETMAQNASDRIAALARQMNFYCDPVPVVLSGSIHTRLPSQRYVSRLSELAEQKSKRKLSCRVLSVEPVLGCATCLIGRDNR